MKNKTFDDFSKLVNNYKQLIRADHNFPEIYKWECVKQYQTFFDIDSPDFERVLRDSIKKVKNLVYVNSLGFLIRAAKH